MFLFVWIFQVCRLNPLDRLQYDTACSGERLKDHERSVCWSPGFLLHLGHLEDCSAINNDGDKHLYEAHLAQFLLLRLSHVGTD